MVDGVDPLGPEGLGWGLALAVGFPLLMIALNELIGRLDRAGLPIVSTLRAVRTLVLPTLGLWLLLRELVGLGPEATAARVVSTLLWIFLLYAGLSFVNDAVFGSPSPGSWRSRVPRLIRDLTRFVLVAVGAAIVYSQVWGESLEGALTALGVGSIVIGLALQEPLGNIVSGLMLMFERPLAVGDWLTVDETHGRVIEINWRSVHILTLLQETLIVPNSELYKTSFTNLSRPDTRRTEIVELGFSYDDPPNKVKRVLLELMRGTEGVLSEPGPVVRTAAYADFAINYQVEFTVARTEDLLAARDAFMTRLWYACKREGLNIPFPTAVNYELSAEALSAKGPSPAETLRGFPQFLSGDPAAIEEAADRLRTLAYGAGETILEEGRPVLGLCLVARGSVSLGVRDAAGSRQEIARLERSDYFGEGSLLAGEPSQVDAVALEDVDLVVLDRELVQRLVERTPRLGRELGALLDVRRRAVGSVRKQRLLRSS